MILRNDIFANVWGPFRHPLTVDGVLPVRDGDGGVDDLQRLLEQKGEADMVGHDACVERGGQGTRELEMVMAIPHRSRGDGNLECNLRYMMDN